MRWLIISLSFLFLASCSSIPGYPTSIAIKLGKKCELTSDNILISSWIWFYDAKDPESLTATKEVCPKDK